MIRHFFYQISDLYWCSPPGKGWACGLTCAELEDDDIEDDYICARRIYKEHKLLSGDGFNAWAVYQPFCKGFRVEKYTEGCFEGNEKSVTLRPRKKQVTKKLYPWQKPQQTMPLPCAHKTGGFPPKANNMLPTVTGSTTSEDDDFSIVPRIIGIPEFSTNTEIPPPSTNRPSSIVQGFTTSTSYVPRSSSGVISGTVKNTAGISRFTAIVPKTEKDAFFSSVPPKFVSSSSFLQAGKGVPNAKRRLNSSTQTSPDSSTSAPLQTPYTFPTSRRFAPQNSIAQITYPASPTADGGIRHQSQRKRESVFIINGQIWT